MFSQLFKSSHMNKHFYIEQYCTGFQHALQLENPLIIMKILSLFYIFTGLICTAAAVFECVFYLYYQKKNYSVANELTLWETFCWSKCNAYKYTTIYAIVQKFGGFNKCEVLISNTLIKSVSKDMYNITKGFYFS